MRAHGILFHHFHDAKHPKGQGAISADDLDRIIAHVDRRRILPAREWAERALAGTLGPRDLCLTFDDNLRCQYDIALPVLEAHGITAFWFVYTAPLAGDGDRLELYRYFRTVAFPDVGDFYRTFDACLMGSPHRAEVERRLSNVDTEAYLADKPFYSSSDRRFRYIRTEILGPARYDEIMGQMMAEKGFNRAQMSEHLWMDEECLSTLHRQGHVVGLHSHTHPTNMAALPASEQEREFVLNRSTLAAILEDAPTTVAHPAGSYSQETLAILRRLGITLGFRADMRAGSHTPLEAPRLNHAILWQEISGHKASVS